MVGTPPQVLRIGNAQGEMVFAATGTSNEGPVFVLPATAWNALIESITLPEEIPANVFAP